MSQSYEKPWSPLKKADPEIFSLIESELTRQRDGIELIASENFASHAVVSSMGNILTNKYAEGLPNKRYYGGCHVVDKIEDIARNRAKELFGCKYVNVQPHSGAQANAAVYLALLNPGDKVLGLDLSHGGHLTHGSSVNFSGLNYKSFFYGVDHDTGIIDMDDVRKKAQEIKPKLIIAGASAYSRTIDFVEFRKIADEIGAYLMVDMAHIAGLVAAGIHPSPIAHADVVTTTTHKTLRGPRGGLILWNNKDLKFNKAVFPGTQGGPLEHIIAAKAVCFLEALEPSFKTYQKQVVKNAQALANDLIKENFKIVSNGTDNHLLLMDLSSSEITGKQMEEALGNVEITVNKNTVPNEKRSPFVTSGIRLGTPAITSRGMKEPEIAVIASNIRKVFENIDNKQVLDEVRKDIVSLAQGFPLYPDWS